MFLLLLLSVAPSCGLVGAPSELRIVTVGEVTLQLPGTQSTARCDGAALVIEGDARWPAPLRLERDERGRWHDVVPLPADARDERWLARDDALVALARNPAVRHQSARPLLLERMADFRLGDFKRIGTMPAAQPQTDAYWSLDSLCVTQGASDTVRCLDPDKRRWSGVVARARRVAAAPSGRYRYDDASNAMFVDGRPTSLERFTAGSDWAALLKNEREACDAALPTLADEEARACADPASVSCAHWARYGPSEAQFKTTCDEPVVTVRMSRDERFALLVARVGETWVLFLGKRP